MTETTVVSPITGTLWKIVAGEGEQVEQGATLLILEAMKTEISVAAPAAGIVKMILAREGDMVSEGDAVLILERSWRPSETRGPRALG